MTSPAPTPITIGVTQTKSNKGIKTMNTNRHHNLNFHTRRAFAAPLLAFAILGAVGCSSHEKTTTESNAPVISHTPIAGKENSDRLAGLLLMHQILDKQRDLDRVVDIPFKTVRPEVEEILTEIANASSRSDDQIKSLIKASGADPETAKTVLPLLEIQSRDGIESITTKEILFGNSKEMEFNLLYNQLQSCRYISQLSLAASNLSKGQDQAMLKGMSDEFTKLYNRTFQIMIKAYKP
jgi:hypothetical protein